MANPKLATTDYVDGEVAKKQDYFADVAADEVSGNRELSLKDATDNVVGQIIAQKEGGVLFKNVATPTKATDGANKGYADNNFANALKGTASGVSVRLDDLSPIEHTLGVKVSSKNLFDTANATKLNGAASFSVANNVITVSQNFEYNYSSANVLIPKTLIGKTVTLSAKSNTSGVNVAGLRIEWVSDSGGAAGDMILGVPDSAGNIVVTGTVPTQPDEAHNNLCLMVYSNSTGTLETGTTYTATYSDIQIELGSTATPYTPYISDFSTVNVTRCGKNLIPYPYAETRDTIYGISIAYGEDGSVIFNGTAIGNVYFKVFERVKFPAGKYYLSGTPTGGGVNVVFLYFFETDNPSTIYNAYTTNGVACSLSGTEYSGRIYIANGQTVENLVFKPQLELGSTATSYEPYQGQTYTPTTTGEVTGITNLYPTTTLMTDTEGAIIEAEYNRDINKAFAELRQVILSMGGNV